MHICRICFFALAFCACTAAEQRQALDASDVALKTADCVRDVAEEFEGADPKDPKVWAPLVSELTECMPEPKKARK